MVGRFPSRSDFRLASRWASLVSRALFFSVASILSAPLPRTSSLRRYRKCANATLDLKHHSPSNTRSFHTRTTKHNRLNRRPPQSAHLRPHSSSHILSRLSHLISHSIRKHCRTTSRNFLTPLRGGNLYHHESACRRRRRGRATKGLRCWACRRRRRAIDSQRGKERRRPLRVHASSPPATGYHASHWTAFTEHAGRGCK